MARLLRDLQKEFNASNNNTTEKYDQNELFTQSTRDLKNNKYAKIEHFLNPRYTLKDYLALLLGGPFAQIYYRMTKARGSLSKAWLLFPLFWIPPFSAIPLYYIAKNKIPKGKSPIKMKDILALGPVIVSVAEYFMSSQSTLFLFIGQFVNFIGVLTTFIIRDKNKCSKKRMLENGIYSATNLLIVTNLLDLFFQYVMTEVPILGSIVGLMYDTVPFGGLVMKSMLTLLSYYIIVMHNNTSRFCKKKDAKKLLIRIVMSFALMVGGSFLAHGGDYYGEEE